jgi:hypothetical protein
MGVLVFGAFWPFFSQRYVASVAFDKTLGIFLPALWTKRHDVLLF